MVFPDCSKGIYRPFRISTREKRELIRRLAENGVQGIDDFLTQARKEGAVAERMDKIRSRISRQIERSLSDRRRWVDDSIKELIEKGRMGSGMVDDGIFEDDTSFRRFSSDEIRGEILASELIMELERGEGTRDYVEKLSLLRRFLMWLKRLLARAIFFIRRSFFRLRKLFSVKKGDKGGRKDGGVSRKGAISLPFPSIAKDLDVWERRLEERLDRDRSLQNAVNQRISDSTGYDSGLIKLGAAADPKWYKQEAGRVLREEVVGRSLRRSDELAREREERIRRIAERRAEDRRVRDEIMNREKAFEQEVEGSKKLKEKLSVDEMRSELLKTLSNMGFIQNKGELGNGGAMGWEITEGLIRRFSELIYGELMEAREGRKDLHGHQISDAGVYEKGRLRTVHEETRMDILTSLVNARTRHPNHRDIEDQDIVVYREVTTSDLHAVLLIDISGSMEENNRLEAAKRSVLALSHAVKREDPRNRVDIIAVSTRPRVATLREVMSMEPRGFTNIQESIALARSLFDASRSERHLLFLITDGLPEAYLSRAGKPVAGDLEVSMELALVEVKELRRYRELNFTIFLLEAEDDTFVDAARKIARAGSGKVVVVDPVRLGREVLGSFSAEGCVLGGV